MYHRGAETGAVKVFIGHIMDLGPEVRPKSGCESRSEVLLDLVAKKLGVMSLIPLAGWRIGEHGVVEAKHPMLPFFFTVVVTAAVLEFRVDGVAMRSGPNLNFPRPCSTVRGSTPTVLSIGTHRMCQERRQTQSQRRRCAQSSRCVWEKDSSVDPISLAKCTGDLTT